MPGNPFDKAARYAAKLDPPTFLGWLLGVPPAEIGFSGWVDARRVPFPGEPERTGDTVAHLADATSGGQPWAVAVEFQVEPDPEMFGRLLGYLSGLWGEVRPDPERGSRFHVGAAVVNLSGSGSAGREMRGPAAGLVTHLVVRERNLARESAADLLRMVETKEVSRVLLPWVPLMLGADESGMIEWWKRLADAESDNRRKSDYAGLAKVFAGAAKRYPLWADALKEWNVQTSEAVEEWKAETNRAVLLRLGTKKFGRPPTKEEQQATLNAIPEPARLEELIARVLDVTTWGELLNGG